MVIVDDKSIPIATIATSAQPHEISLVEETSQDCPIADRITHLEEIELMIAILMIRLSKTKALP
ncbi:hypothetical protein [Candidatus Odyssella thessalonicensis]|uniref:hypothetical protein n=1 Tax=Candidatus Odyssella thessalonicensis TaxID=84647 RepID=UPI000225B6DE|nr:hypothetical protein [Candidatus Odyssella thessalonicensis]